MILTKEKIRLEDEGVARINRKLSDDFLFLKRKSLMILIESLER